jgi:hypothetical protein
MGYTQPEGLKVVQKCDGDFSRAILALDADPFAAQPA